MESETSCTECGANLAAEETCQDAFHQMLFWEAEQPPLGEVHHLMVLCFHLQHPSLYSPEGLTYARQLLQQFVAEGLSPAEVRQRHRSEVNSGRRTWKIKGTAVSFGTYDQPVVWTVTAVDVVAAGADMYVEKVHAWARSVYTSLQKRP